MAAYSNAVIAKFHIERFLLCAGACFLPHSLKLLQSAHKELNSFLQFLTGLDGSTRERLQPSIQRFAEAMLEFCVVVVPHIHDQINSQLTEARRARSLMSLEVDSLQQEFHALFEMMKKIKQERFNGADFGGSKSKLVGLSDVHSKLKQDIMRPREKKVKVYSIVGMAGIGKTALAEAIFEDLDVAEWFEHRVWVPVGRHTQPEELSRRILAQLDPDIARKLEEGNEDAGPCVREILDGRVHLIVLDDVWNAQLRGHMEDLLSNTTKESRIILTSRSRFMVKKAKHLTEMRLLNEKESWVLLRQKLFDGNRCPLDLEEVGKKIAEKCDGLPLTIVTVADLLSKIPKSLWTDVATQRKHQVFTDAYDEISKVLYPSYEDIPYLLKSCFLHMAVFPPKHKISRSKLTIMWFVEGLLLTKSTKDAFEYADHFLIYFSANSLIMVYQRRSIAYSSMLVEKPKSCGLHTSWFHLCYTEARKENLFYILISRQDGLKECIKEQSMLSIHNNILFAIKDVYASMEKHCASTAYSLLCLGPYQRYPVRICFGLMFLKNLDALNIRLYEFPLEVLKLKELQYFALTCDGKLPHSISKLHNLHFFIVLQHHNIRLHGVPSYLPKEIWDMKELEHFQISGSDLPDDMCSTILPNLSTLLDVSDHSCTKSIFERIPHLKKLGIKIELKLDDVEPSRCFNHISQLKELEILKCVVVNPVQHKFEFVSPPTSLSSFPLGLKKLTLSGLGYPWEEMSKIASLPCLEVLKLRCNAFRGPKWVVEENGFPNLIFLEIEDIDLMQWRIERGSFNKLQFISIKHCYRLQEFHWEFHSDQNIMKIDIVDSNPSLENQVKEDVLRQGYLITNLVSVKSSWEAEE